MADIKNSQESKKSNNKQIVEEALERFKMCEDHESKIRSEARDDLRFRKGDQWPSEILNMRSQEGRPSLTINKMAQYTRQITNDQKQNRPAIKVSPVDDGADVETAKMLQGLIRNIENVSDAEYAYDKAFESAVQGSFGFFRIATKYVDEKSFEQEACIKTVDNPFRCFLDPYSILPDGSDAEFGFHWETISKEEFKRQYGEEALAEFENFNAHEENVGWVGEEEVRIADYFYKEYEDVNVYLLSNGETYFEDELPEPNEDGTYTLVINDVVNQLGQVIQQNEIKFKVERVKKSQRCKVIHAKISGVDVIDMTEFPSKYIPIIPVYGDTINVDGEVIRESVIRHAKDPQRILNYWASTEAEAITLAPKAPFIGAAGQFEGFEDEWASANSKNIPYLQYNPVTYDGQIMPPPQRNSFEPPVMALTNARMQANEDIKATTGIYDASLGNRSNETSGVAIQRRNLQAQTSNFHFLDNLSKSIRHAGRILVDIIPRIYDTERVVRILGLDGEEKLVKINAINNLLKDQDKPYDLSIGKYDVSVSVGASFETKRQEARESLLELAKASPKFSEFASDLIVKNMDFPDSEVLADRLRKLLPPNLLDNGNKDIPPQVIAQMEQMGQQVQLLQQQLQEAASIIEKDQLQIQSKERIENMKIEADLKKELFKAQTRESEMMMKNEIEQLNKRVEMLGQTANERELQQRRAMMMQEIERMKMATDLQNQEYEEERNEPIEEPVDEDYGQGFDGELPPQGEL